MKRILTGLVAALLMLAMPAHADFITGNTSLPASKTNLVPLPPTADPTKYIQASDYNSLMQALLDSRNAIVQGAYSGFTAQVSNPNPVYTTNYFWFGTNGQLHFTKIGPTDNQVAFGPVTTKGDLLPYNGTNFARLGVGADGTCLQAASGQATGLTWGSCGGGSTGNYTFSANNMTLTGAATATLFTSTATGLTVGGSNLTSGFTITGGAASTVTTTSGGLSLTAAGTVNVQNSSGAVVLGNATGITTIRGGSTGSFDMSAANGVTKTTTGTHTFGGATWVVPASWNVTSTVASSGTPGLLQLVGTANTGLTASTEVSDVDFNLARTVQWSTGALATQRFFRVRQPTIAFVGASNVTGNISTMAIGGPPVAGTNATFTGSAWTLLLESGNLGFGANAAIGQSTTSATNTVAFSLNPNVLDGASSVALNINNLSTLSSGTADLVRFQNNGTSIGHVRLNNTDGFRLVDNGGSSALGLSTNAGSTLCYSGSCYTAGVALTLTSATGDGTLLTSLVSSAGQTVAGGAGLRIDMDAATVNNPVYGVTTAAGTFSETGTWVNVSGTVAVGDVCVWTTGTANTVARAAATNNLTTIAGISTAAQTGGKMYLVTRGRAMVNSQAGVTVGTLVGTSSGAAGNIGATTPTLGAVVGRALEATGATTANKTIIYVTL